MAETVSEARRALLDGLRGALARVEGKQVVETYLRAHPPPGDAYVLALGKAAESMTAGAIAALGGRLVRGLLITKHHHLGPACRDRRIECIEAGHPVPDQASLAAGERLLAFIRDIPHQAEVIVLVSGGTSALAEQLPAGTTLDDLQHANRWLLGSGLDIDAVNRVRRGLSCIKAGRLARYLEGRRTCNLLMSDVPGDEPAVIGSGLLVPHPPEALAIDFDLPDWLAGLLGRVPAAPLPDDPCFRSVETCILVCNRDAREGAAAALRRRGLAVTVSDRNFIGDAETLGRQLARELLKGPPSVRIWGGESTVVLPAEPGRGGRNQTLALAAALELQAQDGVALLAVGTDGTDGPTDDAGALVDGGTVAHGRLEALDPDDCLQRADAGTFLEASGDLVQTGPTGTNVMDLVIGIRF